MLSKRHIRLLKQIEKHKVVRETKINNDLEYLFKNGYITVLTCDKPDDYFAQPSITEKGKARLSQEKRRSIEKWIPIFISLIALIKSFMPDITLLLKRIMQLMK